MLTDIDTNNYISFGVLADDGVADITLSVNDRIVFNISAKGVPILSVPFSQISGFVQNVCHPETLTIYYKKTQSQDSTYLPQNFNAVNQRICSIIASALQSMLVKRDVFVSNWYFSVFKAGSAEKQGKRLWATRYLMIIGCRLLVYRYPISKKRGNANIPLNVIDLTNALIQQKNSNTIVISTHRDYEFRFISEADVPSWIMELKSASSRGLSLFNEHSCIQVFDSLSTSQRSRSQTISDAKIVSSSSESSSEDEEISNHDSLLQPLPSFINSHQTARSSQVVSNDDSLSISFYSWGSNASNQLGLLSDEQCFSVPTKVTLLSAPRTIPLTIAAGGSHAMCLTDDGELYVWGMGDKGQLGMGPSIIECTTPHTIPAFSQISIMSIACGGNHSMCISNTGTIYSWGQGMYGQLGQGLDIDTATEPMVLNKLRGKDICNIACGQNHTLFLASNGSVYACGNGYYGQLGLEREIDYFSPVIVKSLLSYTITQIACGETFSLFVTDKNQLIVTGLLEVPEHTFDQYKERLSIPHIVPFDHEILQIAAGTRFALILVKNKHYNDVYYWKADEHHTDFQKPALIASLSTMHITNISCGASHCIAFSSVTGRAFSWGTNYCGELGNGSFDFSLEPHEIQSMENEKFIEIVAGNAFSLGLTLPLSSRGKRLTVIDEVHIEPDEVYDSSITPTPNQQKHFTFNTLEINEVYEKPRSIHSPLSSSGSVQSGQTSVPLSETGQPENDIIFQNRAARAAALEKQFQFILRT